MVHSRLEKTTARFAPCPLFLRQSQAKQGTSGPLCHYFSVVQGTDNGRGKNRSISHVTNNKSVGKEGKEQQSAGRGESRKVEISSTDGAKREGERGVAFGIPNSMRASKAATASDSRHTVARSTQPTDAIRNRKAFPRYIVAKMAQCHRKLLHSQPVSPWAGGQPSSSSGLLANRFALKSTELVHMQGHGIYWTRAARE